ncbi:MAG: DUF2071 domain-containing protein [Thermomicrobiales bacterium]
MDPLRDIDHRPYPVEPGPWVMGQRWHDLLFAHWRVEPERLQALLPEPLEIDIFDGSAWIAVVPFAMSGVRLRGLPGNTRLSSFLELNVRTYARLGDRDGVFFFSLDAASRVAVSAARRWFHLPYFNARMDLRQRGDQIHYRSRRTHRGAAGAELGISYRPTGPAAVSAPGSLEEWLVERYRLLVARRDGRIMSGEIHHGPWLLQPVEVEIHRNTMTDWLNLPLSGPPDHIRFARFQDVVVWRPKVIQQH